MRKTPNPLRRRATQEQKWELYLRKITAGASSPARAVISALAGDAMAIFQQMAAITCSLRRRFALVSNSLPIQNASIHYCMGGEVLLSSSLLHALMKCFVHQSRHLRVNRLETAKNGTRWPGEMLCFVLQKLVGIHFQSPH